MTTTSVELIAAEREKIGTFADLKLQGLDLDMGELALAAACYALYSSVGLIRYRVVRDYLLEVIEKTWPFPTVFSPGDRLNNLAKAGAYIAAEIDRVQKTGAV